MEPTETSTARRRLAAAALAALSAITGVISYRHGLDVARWVGNTGLVAFLVPLVPDLMIVTSSLTLMEAAALRARRPWMAMLSLVAGIGWTVAMNVAAGWQNGPGGALVAGGVPVAFVVTLESLLWLRRPMRSGPSAAGCSHTPAMTLDEAIKAAVPLSSQRAVADAFEVSRSRVVKALAVLAEQTPAVAVPDPSSHPRGDGTPPRPAAMANGSHGG